MKKPAEGWVVGGGEESSFTLVMVPVFAYARWQSQSALQQVAELLHVTPTLSVEGGNRDQILRWTKGIEPGAGLLPNRLDRVQFLGAIDDWQSLLQCSLITTPLSCSA